MLFSSPTGSSKEYGLLLWILALRSISRRLVFLDGTPPMILIRFFDLHQVIIATTMLRVTPGRVDFDLQGI